MPKKIVLVFNFGVIKTYGILVSRISLFFTGVMFMYTVHILYISTYSIVNVQNQMNVILQFNSNYTWPTPGRNPFLIIVY